MTKTRVLIIGPEFYGYNESVMDAFVELGYEVEILSYCENPIKEKKGVKYYKFLKQIYRFGHKYFLNKHKINTNKAILEKYSSFKPDIVLIIKGNILEPTTLDYMNNTQKILWMMDSVFRERKTLESIEKYDYKFMFEKSDVDTLKMQNIESYFLPLALNKNVYYPLDNVNKEIDIVFVGTLYKTRRDILEKIVKEFKDYNIKIYGEYLRFRYPSTFLKFYLLGYNKYFTNKNISPQSSNRLYNNSKIALNIHHEQSNLGCNPRVFELLGCKTFQLVDKNQYVMNNFSQNEIVFYHNLADLLDKIRYYLEEKSDRNKIAENGYNKVIENHTFKTRVMEIIKVIN